MKTSIPRPQVPICQLCDFITVQRPAIRNSILRNASKPFSTYKTLQVGQDARSTRVTTEKAKESSSPSPSPLHGSQNFNKGDGRSTSARQRLDPNAYINHINHIIQLMNSIFSSAQIPKDEDVKEILVQLRILAEDLVGSSNVEDKGRMGASGLLSLGEGSPTTRNSMKATIETPGIRSAINKTSELAEKLICYPTVFISPEILHLYTEVQARLGKPKSFPKVFELYATKPIPKEGSSPIVFEAQKPNNSTNAIPAATAELALQTAINAKELITAMGIVEESYSVPAYKRAKFIRKALLPITGFSVAPVAVYTVASQMASYQSTMDPTVATNVAFAGIASYLAFTGTIGFVALSTANDQMDRVTWAQGMPLRERWIREDERAAVDKIAGAWGFRQTWRRGEEEGQDWETLREWIGRKGMVLDKVDLMEGME